jgi:hypothetical protein
VNFFYTLRIIVSQETYLLTVKELELKEGGATGIPAILKSLEDNESPLAKFNTGEDRSFFEVVLFIHETMAGGIAEKMITVLKMTKITTLAKSKENIFLLAPIFLIIGSNLNLLPYYSFVYLLK